MVVCYAGLHFMAKSLGQKKRQYLAIGRAIDLGRP